MLIHKLAVSVTLAIATAASWPLASFASTRNSFVVKQLDLQTSQPQANQPELQSESISTDPEANQSTLPSESIAATDHARPSFFNSPPRLVRTAAYPLGGFSLSAYEFTLTVPQDAGQPLKSIKITQTENLGNITFDLNHSKAFIDGGSTTNSEVRLTSAGGDQHSNSEEVTIVFDQPVQPGNTVTVSLAVRRSPLWSGVYLFGVTAYPTGDNSRGQFLGYGRINVYGNLD